MAGSKKWLRGKKSKSVNSAMSSVEPPLTNSVQDAKYSPSLTNLNISTQPISLDLEEDENSEISKEDRCIQCSSHISILEHRLGEPCSDFMITCSARVCTDSSNLERVESAQTDSCSSTVALLPHKTSDVGTNTPLQPYRTNEESDSNSNLITDKVVDVTSAASTKSQEYVCSLYVTACPTIIRSGDIRRDPVRKCDLEEAIQRIKPIGAFRVTETKCGLIAAFTHEVDADNLLLNLNLAQALHGPVQVARFSRRDTRYKQIATLRDVPWSIPMQDVCTALTFQGISYENVDRFRNNVRVEVLDATHYENLIEQGLNFFEAARFLAVPERWYRNTGQTSAPNSESHLDADSVLQCYRCQGFWHVAANCRHLPRCVRCGEPHGVEFCPRPRNNPVCCHCSGAHHAAYKNCPVRVQLMNAMPVSMSLSTSRNTSQPREIRSRCRSEHQLSKQ